MKIYLTDQRRNLDRHLGLLKSRPVMGYDRTRLKEKTTTIGLTTDRPVDRLDLGFLFDYRIFPENIMSFKTEWESENRKMRVGDTIVQQVYLPPIGTFSQKLIFGVRVNGVIDQAGRKGFSYETLEGHVEKGVSTFTIEEHGNGPVFKIQTYSAPGNILTRLLGPVFAVPYQTFCTKAALSNAKRQIESHR